MAAGKAGGARLWPWLGIALVIVLLDQFTKTLIMGYYELGQSTVVAPFFNIVRAHNTGAAFSFLAGASGWQRWFFLGIGVVAVGFIVFMLHRHGHQRLFAWALTLILGGAVGNVLDRAMHGYVVDFLDFHAAGWHFPAFNVADCGISIGAALLILDELLRVRRGR